MIIRRKTSGDRRRTMKSWTKEKETSYMNRQNWLTSLGTADSGNMINQTILDDLLSALWLRRHLRGFQHRDSSDLSPLCTRLKIAGSIPGSCEWTGRRRVKNVSTVTKGETRGQNFLWRIRLVSKLEATASGATAGQSPTFDILSPPPLCFPSFFFTVPPFLKTLLSLYLRGATLVPVAFPWTLSRSVPLFPST